MEAVEIPNKSMEDNDIEIPEYFICPISLQIMRDPVTAVSGITYDRDSIEHWLFKSHNTICPVTKHPLPPHDSDHLTPNHTLRRLIQAWCAANHGIDRIPTPKPPLSKFHLTNLIRDLSLPKLQKLESLAADSDRNRVYMVEAGLGKALVDFIVACYRKREAFNNGMEEAVGIMYAIRGPLARSRAGLVTETLEIFDALIWGLGLESDRLRDCKRFKFHAACVLKIVVRDADPGALETLGPGFFAGIARNLRLAGEGISIQGMNALLHVLLEACPWGRNRVVMVESGIVFELIELELRYCQEEEEKKTTELVLGILYHLCSCADGRAEFLRHAAGMAVVTRRILKVSATADDRAVLIVWLISKYSGTKRVIQEMLREGTVAKLCTVMQAACGSHLKEKAREILRRYFEAWKDSPCVQMATLTKYGAR